MKKILCALLFVFSGVVSLQGIEVEARVAAFFPEDHRMGQVYDKVFPEYEIELSAPLNCCCDCSCNWDYFFNVSYYHQNGHSSCLKDKTTVDNWAFNLGVKHYFDICECFRPYLGLGAGPVNVKFHDQSPYVRKHTDKWGAAVLVKSGVIYDISCNIFLDAFFDYTYHWFHFNRSSDLYVRTVNTGGFKLGAGIGYRF